MGNFINIKDISLEEAFEMAENGLCLIIRDGKLKGFATK